MAQGVLTPMLSYREALDEILGLALDLGAERVPLLEAGGRILAGPITAPWPLPRFDNSAMDGFVVRCADLEGVTEEEPLILPIEGESAAGHPYAGEMPKGGVLRISTGAQIPAGADGIVPIERVQVSDHSVLFTEPAVHGRYIRVRGEDVAEGTVLFGHGTRLDPAILAYLGMYNLDTVDVVRRPRVALLTSGDEIKPLGAELRETDVVGVNIYYLDEELRAFGCETRNFGIAPDDPDAFRRQFEQALAWGDLLITTAGVSVGEHDVVGGVLESLGADIRFWKVSVRPGKPMLVATIGGKPYFGLPGNPMSVCGNTEIFVKPYLRRSMGILPVESPREPMVLASEAIRDRSRLFFAHAQCALENGQWKVYPFRHQSSGNLANAAHANCMMVIEPGEGPLAAGEKVDVIRLSPGR